MIQNAEMTSKAKFVFQKLQKLRQLKKLWKNTSGKYTALLGLQARRPIVYLTLTAIVGVGPSKWRREEFSGQSVTVPATGAAAKCSNCTVSRTNPSQLIPMLFINKKDLIYPHLGKSFGKILPQKFKFMHTFSNSTKLKSLKIAEM